MGGVRKKTGQEVADVFFGKLDAFVDEMVDAMGSYTCTRCGGEHVALELAFKWPAIAIRLGIARESEPDDRIEIGGRLYIRGTLRVPIHETARDFAVGIWLELDRDGEGLIANQLALDAPLLGERARVVPGAPGFRPTFELIDHPLARAQREGIALDVANRWRSQHVHAGEPEPLDEPFRAALDVHGWELLDDASSGWTRYSGDALEIGDFAKVLVRLVTVGEDGEPEPFIAGWWIAVDHVDGDRVSGTLHSVVPVPATLSTGTRMWPDPDQIFARQKPDD